MQGKEAFEDGTKKARRKGLPNGAGEVGMTQICLSAMLLTSAAYPKIGGKHRLEVVVGVAGAQCRVLPELGEVCIWNVKTSCR